MRKRTAGISKGKLHAGIISTVCVLFCTCIAWCQNTDESNSATTGSLATGIELARYETGSLGITPHRDGFKYKNLIGIFMIGGRGRFYVCSDRAGNDAREIDASPGNVILMKAPGFLGRKERPFHYVTDIQGTRYIFGLRQSVPRR